MTQNEIFNAAINYAIKQGSYASEFLRDWRQGDTSQWLDFEFVTVTAPITSQPLAWLIEYEYLASTENINGSVKKFKENWGQNSFVSEDRNAEIEVGEWRNRKETALVAAPSTSQPLTPHEIGAFVGTHEFGPEQLKWFRFGEAAQNIKGGA